MLVVEEVFLVAHGLCFKSFAFLMIFQLQLFCGQDRPQNSETYLLPENHPVKQKLDSIFKDNSVLLNLNNLQKAGFEKSAPRKFTKLIVTKHKDLPGYIFKLYLHSQRSGIDEIKFWMMRINGANKIRTFILDKRLDDKFKVPQKWIYKLPKKNSKLDQYYLKNTILVEEDMDLLSDDQNKNKWKNDITQLDLDNIYLILNELGLYDCAKPDNIPFSQDGKIAFIDTQTHGCSSINYKKLIPYLSKDNQNYWKKLNK